MSSPHTSSPSALGNVHNIGQPGANGLTPVVRDGMPNEVSMRSRRASAFDAGQMPENVIRKREIHAFSVHHNVGSAKWIATIIRPTNGEGNQANAEGQGKQRCVSFSFNSEREARRFAKAYSPPKMISNATCCIICDANFGRKLRSCNCRNCGVPICEKCSVRWGVRMIPKTYLPVMSSLTVRVCKSCDWLSNAFCMALLQGRYEHALKFFESGNINLRCSFADINKEAMFPIHCAVLGGNLSIVKWLMEVHGCPYSMSRDPKTQLAQSVQTSAGRTLIDLAMTGKPKIDILSYLVKKNLSITDTKDPNLAPKTLQLLMKAGFQFETREYDDGPSSIHLSEPCDSSVATGIEDACVLCCENQMDCVLTPCGHQICCSTCGSNLKACPICKSPCTMLRVFRL